MPSPTSSLTRSWHVIGDTLIPPPMLLGLLLVPLLDRHFGFELGTFCNTQHPPERTPGQIEPLCSGIAVYGLVFMVFSWAYATLLVVAGRFLSLYLPIYKSMLAISRATSNDGEETKKGCVHWVMFWVLITPLFLIESLLWVELIPLYYEIKFAFLLWLHVPWFNGVAFLYDSVVHPYLVQYEGEIDSSIEKVSKNVGQRVGHLQTVGLEVLSQQVRRHGTTILQGGMELLSSVGKGNAQSENDATTAPDTTTTTPDSATTVTENVGTAAPQNGEATSTSRRPSTQHVGRQVDVLGDGELGSGGGSDENVPAAPQPSVAAVGSLSRARPVALSKQQKPQRAPLNSQGQRQGRSSRGRTRRRPRKAL